MDSYVDAFQAAGGSMVMLAKGNRSAAVRDACKKHGGFYLASIGGAAANLAEHCIKKVEVLEYPELGMEAIWRIEVEDFPAFIVIDDKGNDFFKELNLGYRLIFVFRPHHADRAVRGRRFDRRHRTHCRRGDAQPARPDGDRRKPRWRRRLARHRGDRARSARRLDDRHGHGLDARHQSRGLREAAPTTCSPISAPIGLIAEVPNIMSINPGVPAKNMASFIALAKAKPDGFAYGSSGNGSVSHLMGEQFKLATGTKMLHVPYRGVGPALADTVGGQIQVMFDNLPTSLPLVQDGKLRALGVSAPQRLAVLPQVPTFAELNLAELNWSAFFGLVAPAHTPQPVVARLNAALNEALAQASVRDLLSAQQATVTPGTPAQFSALIGREMTRMQRATQAANIRIE